jgi:hypothetical protein
MRRVARRVVVFTYDSSECAWRRRFWLTRDYLPEAAGLADADWLPRLADAIGGRAEPVLIPWDCATVNSPASVRQSLASACS